MVKTKKSKNIHNKICPNCGKRVSKKDRFCRHCGSKLYDVTESVTKPAEIEESVKLEFSLLPKEKILAFYTPVDMAFAGEYLTAIILCVVGMLLSLAPFIYILGWLLFICGVILFIVIYFYARGHKYCITNKRIIISKTFITREIRELSYDKITDIAIKQGLLGRLFNFGTIIPLTASGLGTSSYFVTDSKGRIIKSIVEPATESYYALKGIEDPLKAKDLISKNTMKK